MSRRRKHKNNTRPLYVQADPTKALREEMVHEAMELILSGHRDQALLLLTQSVGVCARLDRTPLDVAAVKQRARQMFGKLGVRLPFTSSLGRMMLSRAA